MEIHRHVRCHIPFLRAQLFVTHVFILHGRAFYRHFAIVIRSAVRHKVQRDAVQTSLYFDKAVGYNHRNDRAHYHAAFAHHLACAVGEDFHCQQFRSLHFSFKLELSVLNHRAVDSFQIEDIIPLAEINGFSFHIACQCTF